MTDYANRLPLALAVCAFGVAGFVSMYVGSGTWTAIERGLLAGFALYVFGKALAYAFFYDPASLPSSVLKEQPPPHVEGEDQKR